MSPTDLDKLAREWIDQHVQRIAAGATLAEEDASLAALLHKVRMEAADEAAKEERERAAQVAITLARTPIQCTDGEWVEFDDMYGGREACEKIAAAIRAGEP